jgi:hypothetical protein
MIGFCLYYRWRDELFARVVGFDYEKMGDDRLYANLVFYEPIRYAIDEGIRRLHLGAGSLETKLLRGGELAPLWSLVCPPADVAPEVQRSLDGWNERRYQWWKDELGKLSPDFPEATWVAPGREPAPGHEKPAR